MTKGMMMFYGGIGTMIFLLIILIIFSICNGIARKNLKKKLDRIYKEE